MKRESNLILYGALVANFGIALAKFVAAAMTGSSAMLTEGFHSVVDSFNEVLLIYGKRRAARPPDSQHPFGYGRELYFWSLIVALIIFAVGAGFSIYEGIRHVMDPEPIRDPTINYVVLGVALLLEGASWRLAVRGVRARKGALSWWQVIERTRDPPDVIVLLEDSAALLGILIAAAGIFLSQLTGSGVWDGAASIGVGCVLALVSILLARMSKELLIGERPDPAMEDGIRQELLAHPGVVAINHLRAIHTGPHNVLVAMSVDFDDAMTVGELEQELTRVRERLVQRWPDITSLYIRPEHVAAGATPALTAV